MALVAAAAAAGMAAPTTAVLAAAACLAVVLLVVAVVQLELCCPRGRSKHTPHKLGPALLGLLLAASPWVPASWCLLQGTVAQLWVPPYDTQQAKQRHTGTDMRSGMGGGRQQRAVVA